MLFVQFERFTCYRQTVERQLSEIVRIARKIPSRIQLSKQGSSESFCTKIVRLSPRN